MINGKFQEICQEEWNIPFDDSWSDKKKLDTLKKLRETLFVYSEIADTNDFKSHQEFAFIVGREIKNIERRYNYAKEQFLDALNGKI